MGMVRPHMGFAGSVGTALVICLMTGCGAAENAPTVAVPPSAQLPAAAVPAGDGLTAFRQAQNNLLNQATAVKGQPRAPRPARPPRFVRPAPPPRPTSLRVGTPPAG